MDSNFMEFLGNVLSNMAKGQRQMEEMAQWIRQGFKGFEDLTTVFRKAYGLDRLSQDDPEYLKVWKEAEKEFRKSFGEYLGLFGVVPQEEHLELVRKYEKLKKKVAIQEETIENLQKLLRGKGIDYQNVTKDFQELMEKQTEQFQKVMEGFSQFFNAATSPDEKEKD